MTTAQNGGTLKINDNLVVWDDVAYLWNVSVSVKEIYNKPIYYCYGLATSPYRAS